MVPKMTTVAAATVTLLASALTTGSVANRCGAADAAAGANQPTGMFIQAETFCPRKQAIKRCWKVSARQ